MLCCAVFLGASLGAFASRPKDEGKGTTECLERLAQAYPDAVQGIISGALVMREGASFTCGSIQPSGDYEARLARATLADQLAQPYPAGRIYQVPRGENDPGRMRHIPFFKAMYGSSEAEVRRNLVSVPWMAPGETIWVTRVNGVDKRLARVAAALSKLQPEIKRCAAPHAGAFNWRQVAGTEYLSAHSFGIAIDVNLACSDYWFWDGGKSKRSTSAYRNRLPMEIVEAFEVEGFIWGGKWAHYDTMHFEYRPELLPPERRH